MFFRLFLLIASICFVTATTSPAQTSIMPLGDSITQGIGNGQNGPGYRGTLYYDLAGAGVNFSYLGVNTNSNGNTTGLVNLPAGYINHNGYSGYTLEDIRSNLAGNGTAFNGTPNQGGFWITGGNPTSNGSGAVNRPPVFPDVVLLLGGTNDSFRFTTAEMQNGTALATMQSRLDAILNWFKTNRPNTLIIVGTTTPAVSPPEVDALITSFGAWIINTELPLFPKYRSVNLNPLFRTSAGAVNTSLLGDNVHPNSPGYITMGHAWYGALQAIGIIPKWSGDGAANVWNAGGAANFQQLIGTTTSNVAFAQGNHVYFGDDGSNAPAITLSGTLSPGSVTVTANQAYTFSGSGLLAGTMPLTKNGSGKLTLATSNTYSGATTINGGILQIGDGGTLGTPGSSTITNNATLAFNRSDSSVFANLITGPGAVQQTGSGTTILTAANDYSGATTVASGTLQIGNGGTTGTLGSGPVVTNANLAFNRSDNVTLNNAISGAGSLTKLGANTLSLAGQSSYTGPTIISGGTLRLQTNPPLSHYRPALSTLRRHRQRLYGQWHRQRHLLQRPQRQWPKLHRHRHQWPHGADRRERHQRPQRAAFRRNREHPQAGAKRHDQRKIHFHRQPAGCDAEHARWYLGAK